MAEPSVDGLTASGLFSIFCRIGLTSFGGGLSGWLLREFVHDRKLLSEEEFLTGLAISQALPGINVTNMAIWIGYRLLGLRGAIASCLGILVPPGIFIVVLATFLGSLEKLSLTHVALTGASAAAVGLSLSMGLTAAWRVPRKTIPLLIMAATFGAIGILHWPLAWSVLVLAGASIVVAQFTVA